MNAFQIGGVSIAVVLIVLTLLGVRRGRISRGASMMWSAVWAAMGVSILKPDLTVVLARALGIDRGADLIFYCGIVATLVGFFALMARMRTIEHNITRIARHIALAEPLKQEPGQPAEPDEER